MPETPASYLAVLEDRLLELGASDAQVAAFAEAWAEADFEERHRLRSLGDTRLIAQVNLLDAGGFEHDEPALPAEPAAAPAVQELEPDKDFSGHVAAGTWGAPAPTVREIRNWVGDNPLRAGEALTLELAQEAPRPTLVAWLQRSAEGF